MNSIVNADDLKLLHRKDPLFALIHDRYGAPPDWNRPEGFTTLCRIIMEQQVSIASATAHFNKLNDHLPSFTPEEVLKLSDEAMRNCHVSRQKARYLRALAEAIHHGKVQPEAFRDLAPETIREQLTSVTGIGKWTADIYLMFCLQVKDILPLGDLAVRNAIKELTDKQEEKELLLLTEKWKPFRSLATYYLWHYYLERREKPLQL